MRPATTFVVLTVLWCPHIASQLHADEPAGRNNFVTVHGARIAYVEKGTGPVIVLLHGLADDNRTWQATIDALAPRYRVIAPDLIGHGQSSKPLLNYRPATFADFTLGFLDELKIDRAILVGNSLGGWTALLVALRQPQRVDKLVLVDSAGYANQPLPAVCNPATLKESQELLGFVLVDKKLADDPTLAAQVLKTRVVNGDGFTIARFLDANKQNKDTIDDQLSNLKMPVQIIWGADDRLIPLALGKRFAKDIPHARLDIIPTCGHIPQFECPRSFVGALKEFLTDR